MSSPTVTVSRLNVCEVCLALLGGTLAEVSEKEAAESCVRGAIASVTTFREGFCTPSEASERVAFNASYLHKLAGDGSDACGIAWADLRAVARVLLVSR